jgi:hypothetical protein
MNTSDWSALHGMIRDAMWAGCEDSALITYYLEKHFDYRELLYPVAIAC